MAVRAVRGAIQVAADDRAEILAGTAELVTEVMLRVAAQREPAALAHGHGSSAGLAWTWEGAIGTAADSNARPRPCSGILERRGTDYRAPDRPAYGSCALSPAEFSLRIKAGHGADSSCSACC